MRLGEVDQSNGIQQAGKVVQQIYSKLNVPLRWDNDSKPTIRGLISLLENPFLTSITSDLETFLHYGSKWATIDTSDIFERSTGLPTYDDIMQDPEYHREQKNISYFLTSMYPKMYAVHCKQGFQGMEGDFSPEQSLVFEYAKKVLDGSRMPLPYLKYELTSRRHGGQEFIGFGQEGRHRATVAELLNAHKMPVMIVTQVDHDIQARNSNSIDEFNSMIRAKFK